MIFKFYFLRILYMSTLSHNSHSSFSFLIPPVSPLLFLNLEFLLEFLWLWLCICVRIHLYTTYRVRSEFLMCTCVQAWHLGIGQPMWRLFPGGNWFSHSQESIPTHSSSFGCGTLWKTLSTFSCQLAIVIMILFRQLDCWEFMCAIFPVLSRGCYQQLLCILVLWLLESFCTLFNSFSWAS